MDTSDDFLLAKRLLHGGKIDASTMTPEAWMYAIKEVYTTDDFRTRCLYQRIGDLIDRKDVFLPLPIPRGKTGFEPGIGINTLVRRSPINSMDSGDIIDPGFPEFRQYTTTRILLLIKPVNQELKWAVWDVFSSRDIYSQGGERKCRSRLSTSFVRFAKESEVLDVFREHSATAVFLFDIGNELDSYARDLLIRAFLIGQFASRMKDVYFNRLNR